MRSQYLQIWCLWKVSVKSILLQWAVDHAKPMPCSEVV